MVKHIVFFHLKNQAEGKSKAENAQIIKERLENLKNLIPYLRHAEVGVNIPAAPKTSHDLCLLCEFNSWDDCAAYQVHPEHLKVVDYILKCKDDRVAVDYEC